MGRNCEGNEGIPVNYMNRWMDFSFPIKNKVAKQFLAPQLTCTGPACTLLNSLDYFKPAWMFKKEQLYKPGIYRKLNVTNSLKCCWVLAGAITAPMIYSWDVSIQGYPCGTLQNMFIGNILEIFWKQHWKSFL